MCAGWATYHSRFAKLPIAFHPPPSVCHHRPPLPPRPPSVLVVSSSLATASSPSCPVLLAPLLQAMFSWRSSLGDRAPQGPDPRHGASTPGPVPSYVQGEGNRAQRLNHCSAMGRLYAAKASRAGGITRRTSSPCSFTMRERGSRSGIPLKGTTAAQAAREMPSASAVAGAAGG
eukprot:5461499-Pyramimonas_sp.AAC.1